MLIQIQNRFICAELTTAIHQCEFTRRIRHNKDGSEDECYGFNISFVGEDFFTFEESSKEKAEVLRQKVINQLKDFKITINKLGD